MLRKMIHSWLEENLNSYTILFLLVFSIFVIPLLGNSIQETAEHFFGIAIFFTVIFISPKNRKIISSFILLIILFRWALAPNLDNDNFLHLAKILSLTVFFYAILRLIVAIAQSEEVDSKVILDAINGYLLLGLAFGHLVRTVEAIFPGAYSLNYAQKTLDIYNYFSFVTLSTLGYGDITPQIPISRSLTILTAVSGQLYMAIIIAVIVGKYSSGYVKGKKN